MAESDGPCFIDEFVTRLEHSSIPWASKRSRLIFESNVVAMKRAVPAAGELQ
ncbi:uncharacterized protein FFB20_04447 [Fusarium fujikuroi]|nr:uncharacterized protein FFB20_04447 [Fusarium fujikuroi]SCN91186.1 uncharacterized protein FFC1_06286 [Fusarium fujikuroi]SCN96156.1 uncharacterized protein FFM5_06333 [Fusarium fujikuroi]SCO01783.1 uncharacterized protein FFE2_09852 [Fusarium fujikuroi]SCO37903.1 uncharacterized protein FFNC_05926 [Fusarium fujikuroi]